VSKGKTDRARKILERKFKSVPNYDIDNELSIIVNTIEMQKAYNVSAGISGRLAIFKGLHLKRFLIASWPKVSNMPELSLIQGSATICRSVRFQLLLRLLFQACR